jgi:hypothetical protein
LVSCSVGAAETREEATRPTTTASLDHIVVWRDRLGDLED